MATYSKRFSVRVSVFALIAAAAAPVLAAADGAEAPSVAPSADSEHEGLAEIVVNARKTSENLQRTPVAITALTAETLQNSTLTSLSDVQTLTPSLQVAPAPNNSGTPLISIRGLLSNEFAPNFDPSIGIYLDGVYAGTTIGGLVSNFVDVERVEVLKGPQGTLYGRNTTGGAYNVYTKAPVDHFEGEVGTRIGNLDRVELWGVLNAPIAEGVALRVAGSYTDTNGYGYDTRNDRVLADQHDKMLRGALKLEPSENAEIILRADWQKSRSNGPLMRLAALRAGSRAQTELALELYGLANPTTLADALAFQQAEAAGNPRDTQFTRPTNILNEIWGTSATARYDFGDFEFKSITAYRHVSATSQTQRSPLAQVTFNDQGNGTKQFSQEVQLNGDLLDGKLKLITGGYYYYLKGFEDIDFFQYPRQGTPLLVYNSTAYTKSLAGYGQATYELFSDFHVTGGLRYTDEKKRVISRDFSGGACILPPSLITPGICRLDRSLKFNDLAYSASIDWQANNDVLLYARTGNGFKSGGLPHRVATDPQTSDPFLPEDVTDYEIGVKSQFWNNRVRLNVAAYYTDYTNIQRTVLVPGFMGGSPTTATKNAASARIKGLEAELSTTPVENLFLGGTLAYTDAKYKEFFSLGVDQSDQKFQNVPKWTYSLSGAYTIPVSFGRFRAQADWYWRSSADMFPAGGLAKPARIQKAYGLLNGRLSLQLDEPNIEFALWGKNLTDKRYFNVAFDNFDTAGTINQYLAEPRTYGVEARFRF